jgi:F0F1-type ATP synthase assembly protein I
MGPRPHSLGSATLAAVADPGAAAPGAKPRTLSTATRRGSSPYAEKTRGYFNTLSATSVGLEMAVSVTVPLLFGIWLDGKVGTSPWLMLLCLCFGFTAGVRAMWRYVAAADRQVAESEEERAASPPDQLPAGDASRGEP